MKVLKIKACIAILFCGATNIDAQKAKPKAKPAEKQVSATTVKPNIVIIWSDDVGMSNISAYHRGIMGGSTPSIDRIAKEGILFMGHYAQASCTAGKAAGFRMHISVLNLIMDMESWIKAN